MTASAVKPVAPTTPDKPLTGGSKPSAINDGKNTDPKEVGERDDRATERRAAEKSGQKK